MKRRAIYINEHPLIVAVWKNGRQPDVAIFYGTTGDYRGDTFTPDDMDIPAVSVRADFLYFPKS